MRVTSNNIVIWRIQCCCCKAVFTVLPHFLIRYSRLQIETAKSALYLTHYGSSLEVCANHLNISAMSIYRLVCQFGKADLVRINTLCKLALPEYLLADEKHSNCLKEKVYLPTIESNRVIWHLGYTESKSEEAFYDSYNNYRKSALNISPSYSPKGFLTDGFKSTINSIKKSFPKTKIGNCLLHAVKRIPGKLKSVSDLLRAKLSKKFYKILFRESGQNKFLKIFSLGQKLRRFTEKVKKEAGPEVGKDVENWIMNKKKGWFETISDPNMPKSSTELDQLHNGMDRKLFMMKGFHHPEGKQALFLNGLAILTNFIPYQRRAKNAGKCAIEVANGKIPTSNWLLNIQLLTSGGFT